VHRRVRESGLGPMAGSLEGICILLLLLVLAAWAQRHNEERYCSTQCPLYADLAQRSSESAVYFYPDKPLPTSNSKEVLATVYDSRREQTNIQIRLNFAQKSIARGGQEFAPPALPTVKLTSYISTLVVDSENTAQWTFFNESTLLFHLNLLGPFQNASSHVWWVSPRNQRVYMVAVFKRTPTLFTCNLNGTFLSQIPVNTYSESGWILQSLCSSKRPSITVYDTEGLLYISGYPCCTSLVGDCSEYWSFTNTTVFYVSSSQPDSQYVDPREKSIISLQSGPYNTESTLTVINYQTTQTLSWMIPVGEIPGNRVADWVWALVGVFCGLVLITGIVAIGLTTVHHQKTVGQLM